MSVKMSINNKMKLARFSYEMNGKKRMLYIRYNDLVKLGEHFYGDLKKYNIATDFERRALNEAYKAGDTFTKIGEVDRHKFAMLVDKYTASGRTIQKRNNSPWILEIA